MNFTSLLLILLALPLTLAFTSEALADSTPFHDIGPVQLDSGLISGAASPAAKDISVFKGIPYAQPPVGELRWTPPVPVHPWKGVRPAKDFGPAAPQKAMAAGGGITEDIWQDEDCLYLNVWTPAKSKEEKLPVMVWIHGGGFRIGSSSMPSYDCAKLAQKGVVVVSMNYRLGFFGQFAHPWLTEESEHKASGNYSLLDQILALKWIQKNISQFGGDPDRVTLFGESAGSRSITLLVASPLAKGLFHRGICQSGAIRDVNTPRKVREDQCAKIAEQLGATSLKELRALKVEDFEQIQKFDSNPIVDGWVIPRDPAILYAEGSINKVPLMIGINADEAMLFLVRSTIDTQEKYTAHVNHTYGNQAQKILAAYSDVAQKDIKDAVSQISTDSTMLLPAIEQARCLEKTGTPAYFYYFTRIPPTLLGKVAKSHHGAEIPYVMGLLTNRWGKAEQTDLDLSNAMMTYWTRFATHGNPNESGLPEWPVYSSKTNAYLELGNEIKAGTNLRKDKLTLWEMMESK
ncbi:MAG: carboxylesterase family protein [Desulfobacteraceae bacterium]|nr:carboxylesterase family protein [Desulfobacteraceae bacterium]MBU4055506.1 carboxylesterase family protein [Pseudomonadota bacterium]